MAVAFVRKEECTACEACIESCPVEAISMVDDAAFVNANECTGCEACVSECPVECIEMVED